MASMVAKGVATQLPAMAVQEKGSGNKRKFRAEPLIADPGKALPLPTNDFSSFEFSAEKFVTNSHTNECNICHVNQDPPDALKLDLGLSCAVGTSEATGASQPVKGLEASGNSFPDANWSDLTESELEELVLRNLYTTFKSAILRIIASGYSEEVASKAVLRSGLWYGCKDTLSNIVDNTLAFLQSGQETDPSREHYFKDMQQMEKYILAELVCLVREVRPFFSTGDAMWRLLISDMNVSHACAMDDDPVGSFVGDSNSNANFPASADQSQSRAELKSSESNSVVPFKPNASISCGQKGPELRPKTSSDVDYQISTSNVNEKPFSATGTTQMEEKFVGSRKVSGLTKREYALRQKPIHFEKHHHGHVSKGSTSRMGRFSGFGGLVWDKKLKGVADSTSLLTAKNASLKITRGNGFDVPSHCISTSDSATTFGLETSDKISSDNPSISSNLPLVSPVNTCSPPLPVADTELSLTFPTPIRYNIEAARCRNIKSSGNASTGVWAHEDKKDEMIMKKIQRMRELQNQLQEWTEWANQKVMQAARRLGKDKSELKTLRQEKEEVERLKKEKQTLEENTMKKLSEMENALRKASGQVERANAAVRRLEVERVVLRREMENAKLHAAQSAASCQEVLEREKNTMMKFQPWEKQKADLQDELSAEKSKLLRMQQKLQQAKDVLNQAQDKLNEEEKAKSELATQLSSLKKEREQIELSTRSKENMIKLSAETNLQKHKQESARLEKEISKLRLKIDSSKIAALKRGIDGGSYARKVTNTRHTKKSSTTSHRIPKLKLAQTNLDFEDVKRERECVMCLSEEMSVVFLPCAHQVVCATCNSLHEKQGMKDCPSCRSPIQKRIGVRYARS